MPETAGSIFIMRSLPPLHHAFKITKYRQCRRSQVESLSQNDFLFLPLAISQQAGFVRTFGQDFCPRDLTVSTLSLANSALDFGGRIPRKATIEIHIPSLCKG